MTRGGVHNNGYDDQYYDYILRHDEVIQDRYVLKHRIGKVTRCILIYHCVQFPDQGSFGQVVCAYDKQKDCEVAIKIIKSKRPFYIQAQTEIELLHRVMSQDENKDNHIVRLTNTFVHRQHQCLVFEMLSYNLYELLKNTK